MTNQGEEIIERIGCIIWHCNREGRDFFTPRKIQRAKVNFWVLLCNFDI
jgi:hypothetical protein